MQSFIPPIDWNGYSPFVSCVQGIWENSARRVQLGTLELSYDFKLWSRVPDSFFENPKALLVLLRRWPAQIRGELSTVVVVWTCRGGGKQKIGGSRVQDFSSKFPLLSFSLYLPISRSSECYSILTTPLQLTRMSATSPSSVLGQCVVCGKESTTACSVCKRAGLDWMLFCSKEHQKLVSTPIVSILHTPCDVQFEELKLWSLSSYFFFFMFGI